MSLINLLISTLLLLFLLSQEWNVLAVIPGDVMPVVAKHLYETKYVGALGDGMLGNLTYISNQTNQIFIYNDTELYFTDHFTFSIKKINLQTKVVSVVVGTGIYERGMLVPSTIAHLKPKETNIGLPRSVAVHNGIVYFTTFENPDLIFKVNSDGTGFVDREAGVPGRTGYDPNNNLLPNSTLSGPTFLNVYSNGTLVFYESGSCTIRKISDDQLIRMAGNGQCSGLNNILSKGISAMTISTTDILYISTMNGEIMRWNQVNFELVFNSQVVIKSLAANNDLIYFTTNVNDLSFIPVSGGGSINNNRSIILGSGMGFTSDGMIVNSDVRINTPHALAIGSRNMELYFSEIGNNRIRSLQHNQHLKTLVGYGSGTENSITFANHFINPAKMAIVGSMLYVTDSETGKISRIDVSTGQSTILAVLSGVSIIAASSDHVYVSSPSWNIVYKIDGQNVTRFAGNGTSPSTGDGGSALSASISNPRALALDSKGDLYILSSGSTLRRVKSGIISTIFSIPSIGLNDLFIGPQDEILVSNLIGYVYQLNCSSTPCSYVRVAGIDTARRSNLDIPIRPLAISALTNFQTGRLSHLLIAESSKLSIAHQGLISSLLYNTRSSANIFPLSTLNVNGIAVNQTSGTIYISGPYGISTLTPYTLAREECSCSGNGICFSIDPTNCQCDHGWSGNRCEIPSCGGISGDSSNVCSNGQGICTFLDTCKCNSGFVGSNCQIPFCIGSTLNENFTCTDQSTINNSTVQQVIVEVFQTATELNSKNLTFSNIDSIGIVFPSNFSTYLSKTNIENNMAITLVSSVVDTSRTINQNSTLESQIVSPILTLSLFKNTTQRISIRNLESPIELLFLNIQIPRGREISNFTCMFFDVLENDWSEEGISSQIIASSNNFLSLKCETSHLTSFAVIDKNLKKQVIAPGSGGTLPTTSELRSEFAGMSETAIIALSVSIGGSCLVLMSLLILIIMVCVICTKKRKRSNKGF